MNKTIWHSPVEGDYDQAIVINRIVHLSKTDDGEHTIITLDTGEKILSEDSMRSLVASIDIASRHE